MVERISEKSLDRNTDSKPWQASRSLASLVGVPPRLRLSASMRSFCCTSSLKEALAGRSAPMSKVKLMLS